MRGPAGGAAALPSGLRKRRGRAADGAEAVAAVPLNQSLGGGGKLALRRAECQHRAAEFGEYIGIGQGGVALRGAVVEPGLHRLGPRFGRPARDVGSKQACLAVKPQKDRRIGEAKGGMPGGQPAQAFATYDQGFAAPERQHAPGGQQRGHARRVIAQMRRPVVPRGTKGHWFAEGHRRYPLLPPT